MELIGIDYTPPFGVFVGYAPGSRLYLKLSSKLIRLLKPKTI